MPVTRCPHCSRELEIDDADFGYRVQCPACQSAFTPEEPAPPPPPPLTPPPPPPQSDTDDDGTKVVTCPECNGKVGVLEADLGHDMRCPLCDKVFTATLGGLPPRAPRRDDDEDPSWRRSRSGDSRRSSRYDDKDEYDRPRRRRSRYDDDSPGELVANAKRECSASGIGIIIIGVITILTGLLRFGIGVVGAGVGAGAGDEGVMMVINLAYGVYSLVVGAFWVYAGIQLKEAKMYGLCMVGCVMALIPGVSPCCILGLIFGIMGIVKLNDSRVKRGFDANKPDYQGDGYN